MNINRWPLLIFIFFKVFSPTSVSAQEKIKVVTTTNELRWLVEEIGRDRVEVESLLSGHEDPHYIDAVPSYIQKVSRADIVCSIGFSLEVGWLPKVLSRSGNSRVQSSGSGNCEVSDTVEVIKEHHGEVNRSMGDVHSEGNPHFWLSPPHMIQASESIFNALVAKEHQSSEYFLENKNQLKKKLEKITEEVASIFSDFSKEIKISEYHKDFTYFFKTFGLTSGGPIEEVPGVPPSAGRIARVALGAKEDGTHMAIATMNHPKRHMERFSSISSLPFLRHPVMMRDSGEYSDYRHLLTSLATSIVKTLKEDQSE